MDKLRQKQKKDKPMKYVDTDKSPSFITDVKSIKENLKIKEILRTVKMNSSMRIKAPRGSKVMQNKDFNENEDVFDEVINNEQEQNIMEPPSATNPNVVVNVKETVENPMQTESETLNEIPSDESSSVTNTPDVSDDTDTTAQIDQPNIEPDQSDCSPESSNSNKNDIEKSQNSTSIENSLVEENKLPDILNNRPTVKKRERKLSLDQTMLTRLEGLSQSELDLHSIGKSPLERKSSFFRKKMDSFFKNTTEIFKRQSMNSKSQASVHRRGSMSVSLQSLNEKTTLDGTEYNQAMDGSATSLNTASTIGCSTSSLSASQSERLAVGNQSEVDSLAGSQPALSASQPLGDMSSHSINNLNEAYIQESLLNSRAISMSSGLDSASGQRRRKSNRSNRSNRVTWLASEGLTNYFRRVIQDEKSREMQVCHSYQDFSTIPEDNLYGTKLDSKGRRLSYQRAVSGEDPVLSMRYQDSSARRRPQIPENGESNYEISRLLARFSRNGVPLLKGFTAATISEKALAYLLCAERACQNEESEAKKKARLEAAEEVAEPEPKPDPSHVVENLVNPATDEPLSEEINKEECIWLYGILSSTINLNLENGEDARQATIRELVFTEAHYIKHLIAIVRVFIGAAHALQDSDKLLHVDTGRLFLNIPDLLNANLLFWEYTIQPMIIDAIEHRKPFNSELMAPGFCRFREYFGAYEKYVNGQTKALEYLRSLTTDPDFSLYLTWCHGQKSCNSDDCSRLQLADILVKPMQRLTKYGLLLRRIISSTESEPERTSLIAMETFSKNHVLDLNRSIRQREELEKLDELAASIDGYEIDFKDDDMDRYFRMFSHVNLKAPMINCVPTHSRSIIYQGDLRFKDNLKEARVEVRAFLLTDMLLICKRSSKSHATPFKMIRPKYMVDKMVACPKNNPKSNKEMSTLMYVIVDDVGSSITCIALSEPPKDPNPQNTLKLWEQKIREAKLTYELAVWYAKNPSRDLSEVDMDSSSEYGASGASPKQNTKQSSEDAMIEREARERVAAMLHRSMGASTEYDFSQASMNTDSFDADASGASGSRPPRLQSLRNPMQRNSTGGSSRLSSFQLSTSASHDEPQPGPSQPYTSGNSVEHVIPLLGPDDAVTSITVNLVSESETETVLATPQQQNPSPNALMPRPSSSSGHNTLRVQPQSCVMALVHSLPDLSIEQVQPRPSPGPSLQSASDRLYQSHQELLQRNRMNAAAHQHQYLTPDHRGTSYPPPSPTRASLKRGLAFSYSFKYPPLSKMGHVNSQQNEAGPSTSQGKGERSGRASAEGEKKHVSSRHKGGGSQSPNRKDDKGN